MAVTIYQVLNLSDSILEPFKDKPFLLSDYFLSSDSYIKSIYQTLNFSEEIVSCGDVIMYMGTSFDLTTLYHRDFIVVLPPDKGLDLHNNFSDKLRLRFK